MEYKALPMEQMYPLLEEQMKQQGDAVIAVTGFSMLPTLRQGRDAVALAQPGRLRRGDIILYRRKAGQFVLHRIVREQEDGLLCCGDNQWKLETVEREQVLAVVCAVWRKGRKVPTNSPCLWTGLWLVLFPVRRPLLAVRRALGRLKRKWKQRGH